MKYGYQHFTMQVFFYLKSQLDENKLLADKEMFCVY